MPLGIERINARRRQPNERIVFIKPLDGPDKAIAQDFLERVAAIVVPIMRSNKLNLMSLEEFPPNMEFWGRNFNAGECIQLVLKHPRTHNWLSFEQVQYTMIHELAHILQMNHSKAFWSVRDRFANELHELHIKGYTGEGFWSVGRALHSNQPFLHSRPLAENELPQSLCGGTYRERRRQQTSAPKRKITYAERQQRKKERKFGTSEGEKLGGDHMERVKLEQGKGKVPAKAPKIASSKRSRELRAAAALKRFETVKTGEDEEKVKSEDEEGTGSDWVEDWEYNQEDEKLAVDVGGGKRLVPVSAKEDASDFEERNREWLELRGCATVGGHGGGVLVGEVGNEEQGASRTTADSSRNPRKGTLDAFLSKDNKKPGTSGNLSPPIIYIDDSDDSLEKRGSSKGTLNVQKESGTKDHKNQRSTLLLDSTSDRTSKRDKDLTKSTTSPKYKCKACSTMNPESSITCSVCTNVLDPNTYEGAWKCKSGGEYWNPPDFGRCAACGEVR